MFVFALIKALILTASLSVGTSYVIIKSTKPNPEKEPESNKNTFVYKQVQDNLDFDQDLDESVFNGSDSIGKNWNTKLVNAHPIFSDSKKFLSTWEKQLEFSKNNLKEFEGNKEFYELIKKEDLSRKEQAKQLANKCWIFYNDVPTNKENGFALTDKSSTWLWSFFKDVHYWKPMNLSEEEYKKWTYKEFENYWNPVYYACGKGETLEEKNKFIKEHCWGLSDSHTYLKSQITLFFESVGKGIVDGWNSIFKGFGL